MNAVTAEQMEPSNWLAEVERLQKVLQDEKARQEAENSEKIRLAELEKRREVLPPETFNSKGVRLSVFRSVVDSFGESRF